MTNKYNWRERKEKQVEALKNLKPENQELWWIEFQKR